MLFLLALPIISCVALLWRYLQIYAPSNKLIRYVRSSPPRWRTVLSLLALAVVLLVSMHVVSQAIGRGAPGWLNLVVLVLAWDAIKIGLLGMACLLRRTVGASVVPRVRCRLLDEGTMQGQTCALSGQPQGGDDSGKNLGGRFVVPRQGDSPHSVPEQLILNE